MTPAENTDQHDKKYCGGNRRQGEGTCTRPAGWGTPHVGVGRCKLHGGSTPSHVFAGQKEFARQAMETYGVKVDTNPVDALLDEVKWTAGHVAFLREQVQKLEAEALTWGKTSEVEKQATEFPGIDTTYTAQANAWLDLYHRERQHLINVCKAAISAGIEERRVRLAERQGEVIVDVIRAILDDLGLSPDQIAKASESVPRHLRAVAA